MWGLIIILWLIPAFFIANRANKQGRSYFLFLIIGFLLGPILGSIILLMVGENKEKDKQNCIKKCYFCSNKIKLKTTVCNYCGANILQMDEGPEIGVRLPNNEFLVIESMELKQEPNENSKYIWNIEKDEIVKIIQINGDWSFVVRKNETGGWCKSSSLKEIKKGGKNTSIIKDNVDITYKNSWVCSNCQMVNHINNDVCSSCGKEFNPPL